MRSGVGMETQQKVRRIDFSAFNLKIRLILTETIQLLDAAFAAFGNHSALGC